MFFTLGFVLKIHLTLSYDVNKTTKYCSLFYGEIQYETNLRILKREANFLNVKCGRFPIEIKHTF